MSIFNAAMERNQTGLAKKEDLVPISVKITKKIPYYDWTMYYVQFKNNETKYWVRWNLPFSESNLTVNDILPILKEQGLDTKNMSKENWSVFCKSLSKKSRVYQTFWDWLEEQKNLAKQEGTKEKDRYLDYSYTTKKLPGGSNYLVTVTMRMYGQWRKVKYVFNYNSDMWEYEDDQTGKTRYTPISEALDYDVEGMMDDITHRSFTKEEWEDNTNFKDLYKDARATINRYRGY